jgi:ABC-type branched-subunit amino acid transport system permease subunit
VEHLAGFVNYLVTITCIYVMLAISLDLQFGSCGLVNFGQVVFLAFGAYTAGIAATRGASPFTSMLLATLVGSIVGILLSLTVRNMTGTYWGMLSLSMAEIARLIFLNEDWIAHGANGLSVIVSVPWFGGIVLFLTALTYALVRIINVSPFGRTIRLIREGDRLPQALGKNVLIFKMETMALGGAIGGLAGSLYAFLNGYISPDDVLPIETFIVWAMVVLGGCGNVTGIVVGTVLMQAFFVGTRFVPPAFGVGADVMAPLRLVVIGIVIMLVMMFRPQGVVPERRRVYRI